MLAALNTWRLATLVIAVATAMGLLVLALVWLKWLIRAFINVSARVVLVGRTLVVTRRLPEKPRRREWFGS